MLIKNTQSICPVCTRTLDAEIIEEDNKIWIVRRCPDHGGFRDLYWSDAALYNRFEEFEQIGSGISNPQRTPPLEGCPRDCGLCSNHKSATLLANIDLTNRCNLNCDFCFANARACGFLYEPEFEEILDMMRLLRSEKPVPPPAVQFSGGEPTMRDDLVDLVREAKKIGFSQVQIATNGLKIAQNAKILTDLKDAGLSTLYLHFDGVSKETNSKIEIDRKVVQQCSDAKMGLVLVPTIINTRNDHEVGDIIRFAAEHIDVVRGVNFQPVAFTGAASEDDMQRERITIPELLEKIEIQMDGVVKKEHFYPVPCVGPISEMVEASTGKPQIKFTAHQHCGAATYVFVNKDGMDPVNNLVDVDRFFESVTRMSEHLKKGGSINKYKALLEGVKSMRESLRKGDGKNSALFWKLLGKALVMHDFDALKDFHWNALFIGTMHFMDKYNYDIGRVQRCCIHYATPDGRIIPFCTYNSGPVYREEVWKKFSKPLDD